RAAGSGALTLAICRGAASSTGPEDREALWQLAASTPKPQIDIVAKHFNDISLHREVGYQTWASRAGTSPTIVGLAVYIQRRTCKGMPVRSVLPGPPGHCFVALAVSHGRPLKT